MPSDVEAVFECVVGRQKLGDAFTLSKHPFMPLGIRVDRVSGERIHSSPPCLIKFAKPSFCVCATVSEVIFDVCVPSRTRGQAKIAKFVHRRLVCVDHCLGEVRLA